MQAKAHAISIESSSPPVFANAGSSADPSRLLSRSLSAAGNVLTSLAWALCAQRAYQRLVLNGMDKRRAARLALNIDGGDDA